eukprot:TRINITY_DN14863_c0_g1_i1.p1 TRINITY_DN14863_c0_g1~~TRINITY_DN14863_c0_g1_i1.p1  ORF type:complete len:182 (+),score=32.56 TRINITY_DN14863_c0_g1_i1:37-546(+)
MSVVNVRVANIRPKYKDLREWMQNPNHEYVGRAGVVFVTVDGKKQRYPTASSKWANPFKIGKEMTREVVIEKYKAHLDAMVKDDRARAELMKLEGKVLGCWCHPEACHADVILRKIAELSGGHVAEEIAAPKNSDVETVKKGIKRPREDEAEEERPDAKRGKTADGESS